MKALCLNTWLRGRFELGNWNTTSIHPSIHHEAKSISQEAGLYSCHGRCKLSQDVLSFLLCGYATLVSCRSPMTLKAVREARGRRRWVKPHSGWPSTRIRNCWCSQTISIWQSQENRDSEQKYFILRKWHRRNSFKLCLSNFSYKIHFCNMTDHHDQHTV